VRLEKPVMRVDETTTVLVDVKNTGNRPGDEVVQLYIRNLVSFVTRPVKELKGFMKIHLLPGESKAVALTIGPEQLSFTNIYKKCVVEPGEFTIMVGNSSRDQDSASVVLNVI
jgi:beta-glucosidase